MNNIMNRPLFRQAGGPVQPMPQDMGMPPQAMQQGMQQDPTQAVENFEQQASDQMRQVGQQYAMETLASLDAASTPKDVIDALRGTERPIEERYAELATYVGEQDAMATPESVLALVQPTIMLTEEGAMDTGIGQLIQSMTGDTEMSGGMEQGVGSLMMAGAQEAPATENFRQGGPVKKYNLGGEVSRSGQIRGAYEELLPLYREVLGASQQDKDMSKAQAYFDLAGAGLALASGTDPRTGQNMAGAPLASQIARAAAPLPQQFAARAAAQRDAERQIQAGALQGAMSQQQSDEDFMRKVMLANVKRNDSDVKPDLYRVGDQTFNIAYPDGLQAALNYEKETGIPGFKVSTEPSKDTDLPSLTNSEILGIFSDPERVSAFAQGAQDPLLQTAITDYTQPKTNPVTGGVSQNKLPPHVSEAIEKRGSLGETVETEEPTEDTSNPVPVNETDGELFEEFNKRIIDPSVDLSEATGPLSGMKTSLNKAAGFLQELGVGKGVLFKDTAIGRAQLKTLNTEFLQYLIDGRVLADQLKQYRDQMPDPEQVDTDNEALQKINSLRSGLSLALDRTQSILDNPSEYTQNTVDQARRDMAFLKQLKENYDLASEVYTKSLNLSKENRRPLTEFIKQ